MPKLKSNSGAKKRFSTTASGKIKRGQDYKRQNLNKKHTTQKRNLGKTAYVFKGDEYRVKKMLLLS